LSYRQENIKMIRNFIIFTLLCLFFACNHAKNEFRIEGQISGVKDSTYIRLYDIKKQMNIDSSYVVKGKFDFAGRVESPTECWIFCEDEYAYLIVENTNIIFDSSYKGMFHNCSIRGGEQQSLRNQLVSINKVGEQICDQLIDSIQTRKYSSKEERKVLIRKYNSQIKKNQKNRIDFAFQHSDSFFGLNIIYNNRNEISRDSLEGVYENLSEHTKKTKKANLLNAFLHDRIVKQGEQFVDFDAVTIKGKQFKLSNLSGNYIYLSFWNPGCGPCRMENRFLSKHIKEIPDNLSIVSFCTSMNSKHWNKASEQDNISWINLSDCLGENSLIKAKYNVQALPTSFLIDKNGTVLKKMVGFDPEANLVEELKKMIN